MKNFCKNVNHFFTEDKNSAIIWFAIRLYVGWQWLYAGWEKLFNPAWIGSSAGNAISGFLNGALAKTIGEHPDVMNWYAWLIKHMFIPTAPIMSYLVVFGEILIGIALIIGFKTRKAAFWGTFMNFNYLFAGTVSINPFLLLLSLLIISSKKMSSWIGVDRFLKTKN